MKHIEHIVKEHCQKKVKETMNNTTLLIMAAGIGSSFGKGIKQLEPVLKTNDTWYGMTYNEDVAAVEYSRAAEPPVQCGVSHLSRRTEPHCL